LVKIVGSETLDVVGRVIVDQNTSASARNNNINAASHDKGGHKSISS
jgi:hypothetical protein